MPVPFRVGGGQLGLEGGLGLPIGWTWDFRVVTVASVCFEEEFGYNQDACYYSL